MQKEMPAPLASCSTPHFALFLCFVVLASTAPTAEPVASQSQINESRTTAESNSGPELPVVPSSAPPLETETAPVSELKSDRVLIRGNSTILSENRTFELGFFTRDGGGNWYLGIWYASIPTPTYVWVANREKPIANLTSSTLEITETGQLAVKESGTSTVWQSTGTGASTEVRLLDTGNLVTLSKEGAITWQSFDFPTDTWLPGMNVTSERFITSWRSSSDPAPGFYSLRLRPPQYGEFQLVYNLTEVYWSTGNWNGQAFANVPEMTVPYIYRFHFADPFTPAASFWYTEMPLDPGQRPPLTRFHLDSSGQLRQYTWSPQTQNWNMFWSQPDNPCRVYALCGNLGFCNSKLLRPCQCLSGFEAVDGYGWEAGDYSSGCRRKSHDSCDDSDRFEEIGVVGFDGAETVSFSGSRGLCEKACLGNCSCIGLNHEGSNNLCKNLYGSLLNLRSLSSDSTYQDALYVRVPKGGAADKERKSVILGCSIVASVAVAGLATAAFLVLRKRRGQKKAVEDDGAFPVSNLRVFAHKELYVATRGFSEKLGQGGFGTVFRGELSDSIRVAVKRLEKPGGGEKEFRAEVRTIGNIQHVNLVRLRGFCSENSHRLLVYDYMRNGPLSAYLRQDGPNLSWERRFRVAVGTAKGIAYLHEECRDCIIHCDIKPENILLDADWSPKVSDFGLAKLLGRDFSRVLATMRGTWGYVAPEWISGVAITTKADVYSYGMTLLELIGGRRNVEAPPSALGGEAGNPDKWFFPPWAARQIIEGNVGAVVDQRLRGEFDAEEAERVALVAVWCIQDEEGARPPMGMVVKMLEGVVEVAVPPPPKLLQALVSGESFRGVALDSAIANSMVSPGCQDVEADANGV